MAGSAEMIIIGGDVAGRDIIKKDDDIDIATEKNLMYKRLKNIFLKHIKDIDCYIDLHTDLLEQANDGQAVLCQDNDSKGCSVFSALKKEKNIFLVGNIDSGKTCAVLNYALKICQVDDDCFPIYIDIDKHFIEWINGIADENYHNILNSEFEKWLKNFLNIQLSKFRRNKVSFIWDHLYYCSNTDLSMTFELVESLITWLPNAKHIFTFRTDQYIDRIPNSLLVKIMKLDSQEAESICSKYGISPRFRNSYKKVGDLIKIDKSKAIEELLKKMRRCLVENRISSEFVEVIMENIDCLALEALIRYPKGLTYYEVANIISGGKSKYLPEMYNVIHNMVSPYLLKFSKDEDAFFAPDHETPFIIAARGFDKPSVIGLFMSNIWDKPVLMDIIQYCPKEYIKKQLYGKFKKIARGKLISNDYHKIEMIFSLLKVLFDTPCEKNADIKFVDDLLKSLNAIATSTLHSITDIDQYARLFSYASFFKSDYVELIFKKVKPKASKLHISADNKNMTINVEYPSGVDIYASITPLMINQLHCIMPRLSKELIDSVVYARKDVWNLENNMYYPSIDYLLDPVVGLSFKNAQEIVTVINALIHERGYEFEVCLPSIGVWSFIDTKSKNIFINTPPTSLLRPIPCGFCGENDELIYDVYGNVLEWTITSWGGTDFNILERESDYGLNGEWDTDCSVENYRMLKGGSWLFSSDAVRCSCILPTNVNYPDVGMRLFLVVKNSLDSTQDVIKIRLN